MISAIGIFVVDEINAFRRFFITFNFLVANRLSA